MSNYDKDAIDKFRQSGRILRAVREEMKDYVREDMPIIDVCEKAEELIRKKGGKPAFPCNVSINEVAAHYTSPPGDAKKIPRKSLVKVDIGVHVDGYVTDTAVSISFNPEHDVLVKTAEEALKTAVSAIRPEMSTSKIGTVIEKTIKSRGFKPIANLTGHQVGRFLVHAGTAIPNVGQLSFSKVRLGGVYAIEPFVTLPEAAGRVENGEEALIFRFLKSKALKNTNAGRLLEYIEKNFRTLPFAERWLNGVVPKEHHEEAFRELLNSRAIMSYPVFVEVSGKPVAQAEHTVLLAKDGSIVLT